MLTRRCFTLLAATLPLGLLQRQDAEAQTPQLPTIEEQNRRQAEWQKAHHLPVALVHTKGEKRLYSGAVNSVTCWSDVGSVTWLGTRLGIKRVSRDSGIAPRHYIQADGLAGEKVSALVADERGAYALIDLGEQEALCAFEPAKDTWKTLATWQKGLWEYSGYQNGSLALGRDVVVAAPNLVETKADSPLLCFGREGHEARVLPWDAGVRADNTALLVSFLSCREKTVLLGTNIGLIELPLSGDGALWTRRLVEKGVVRGVEGGGRLYLWLAPRSRALEQRRGLSSTAITYSSVSAQQAELTLYDLASDKGQPLPKKLGLNYTGAVVEGDGTLWLIDKTDYEKSRGRPFYYPPLLVTRWKPGDTALTSFYPDGSVAPETPPQQPTFPALYTLLPLPGANVIPEIPARFIACDAPIDAVPDIDSASEYTAARYPAAARWLKERFPHWVSPEDPNAISGIGLFGYPYRQVVFPEPKNPERFWAGRGQGALALVEGKEAQLLPVHAGSELIGAAGVNHNRLFPGAAPGLVTLPAQPIELHAKIRSLISLGDGTYIATGTHAFHISEGGRRWRELKVPPDPRYNYEESLTYSAFFFPAGKGKALLSAWPENTLLRPDISAGKLVRTQIPAPSGRTFIGADSTGAWWHMGGNKYRVLTPGSTDYQERGAEPPAEWSLYERPVLCAGRLWWHIKKKSESQFIGWDPVQNGWTAPLTGRGFSSKMRPITDNHGRVLIAVGSENQKEATVHGWQPRTNRWEPVATFPWNSYESPVLIAAGKEGIWFTDQKSLLRFDFAKKTLQQEALPESNDREMQLWAEGGEIFQIAQERLWQFDRRQNQWREWKVPVTTAQLWPQLAATDGTALWGFLNARNASPPPLFRFDPATHRFSFFDETAGLPHTEGGKLTETGGQIWLLHPTGAFRFDSKSQRFINEVPFRASRIAASQNKAWVWISGEPTQEGGATLYRWSAASGKAVPESNSVQNRCQALLTAGEGVLVATDKGLYKVDAGAKWTPVDTLQVRVGQLMRDAEDTVWATTVGPGYLRIGPRTKI